MFATMLRDNAARLLSDFCTATGRKASGVCYSALKDSAFHERCLVGDQKFFPATYDALVAYLSERWPDGLDWPRGVPRPKVPGRAKSA